MKYDTKKKILTVHNEETQDLFGMKDVDGAPQKVKVGKVTNTFTQELDDTGINNWIKNIKSINANLRKNIKQEKEKLKGFQLQEKANLDQLLQLKKILPSNFEYTEIPEFVPDKEDLNGVKI